ncbi:midasin [Pimephales promelas]|uniref:midasin n=1 Tax=Pimephales promelas TaxID=90988 RepID=UPI0019555121|nr:midasin [Pimephales promelas]
MYKAFDSHLENESKDDEGFLSSSFWTDRESEGEDRDYVKKENRRIERKPERDSNDEKERFVIRDDKKERMKETLQGNEKYVLAETNPKVGDEGSEVDRVEIEKGIDQEKEEDEEKGKENEEQEESGDEEKELEEEEETGLENEEEEESEDEEEESEDEERELDEEEDGGDEEKELEEDEETGLENEEEEESEDEERELDEEEYSVDEEKELEEEEEESEDEETGLGNEKEEESEDEEREFEEEEQKGKESEEEEILKELEEQSQVEGEEEKRKGSEEKESEEEKGETSEEEEKEEGSQEEEGSQDEEEEFELCKQGKMNKKKEEDDLEESEEEEDSEEEKESSVNGENSEENKVQSNDSESEKNQVSVEESEEEEEECFPKEDSNSEEKCTDEDANSDEKKEGLTKEGGSGEEVQDEEEGEENEEGDNVCCVSDENEGIEDKIDGGKSVLKKESTGNSGREKPNEREPKNEEDMNDDFFAKRKKTEENPDSNEEQERNGIGDGNSEEEERECFINEYDKEMELGKSDEKDEDVSLADEHESGMEEEEEVSKGGCEKKEEIDWFFDAPVGEKESWDQDRKSWASDDDYVTISSGHSQKEEEDDHNTLPAWGEERADVRQKEETRDIYDEDFHESLGSPAASILTSGYGTYRPDSSKDGDPEEVDYRDDCTLAGLEEESESILDAHDYEDNSSLVWFGDVPASDGGAPAKSPDDRKDVAVHYPDQMHDAHQFSDTPSKGHQADPQQTPTGNDIGAQDSGSQNVAYFNDGLEVEGLRDSLDHPFNLRHSKGRVQRRPEEKQNDDGYDDGSKGKRVRAYTGCLGTVSELEERLDHMRIGASRVQYDSESEETGSYSGRSSSVTEEPPSAFQEYIRRMTRSQSESDIRPRPKSFIRPVFDHPHTRNLKKTDPVAKYLQYKQDWEMFKPPGEKSRKELHWAIREQLMYQPPPTRPQKTFIPNNYVVPTEKKRSALRWEIRHDLAHGIIPTKISYP